MPESEARQKVVQLTYEWERACYEAVSDADVEFRAILHEASETIRRCRWRIT